MDIGLTYRREGNYLVPNLDLDRESPPLGKYGLMRQAYLREHRPVLWTRLCVSGRLFSHLSETEDAANGLGDLTNFPRFLFRGRAENGGNISKRRNRRPCGRVHWTLLNCGVTASHTAQTRTGTRSRLVRVH